MEPGNPWGAGFHMAAVSTDHQPAGLWPAYHGGRQGASLLDSLSVCFWGLGEEASSVTTGLLVTDEA